MRTRISGLVVPETVAWFRYRFFLLAALPAFAELTVRGYPPAMEARRARSPKHGGISAAGGLPPSRGGASNTGGHRTSRRRRHLRRAARVIGGLRRGLGYRLQPGGCPAGASAGAGGFGHGRADGHRLEAVASSRFSRPASLGQPSGRDRRSGDPGNRMGMGGSPSPSRVVRPPIGLGGCRASTLSRSRTTTTRTTPYRLIFSFPLAERHNARSRRTAAAPPKSRITASRRWPTASTGLSVRPRASTTAGPILGGRTPMAGPDSSSRKALYETDHGLRFVHRQDPLSILRGFQQWGDQCPYAHRLRGYRSFPVRSRLHSGGPMSACVATIASLSPTFHDPPGINAHRGVHLSELGGSTRSNDFRQDQRPA